MNYAVILSNEIRTMGKAFVQALPSLAIAVAILGITWVIARLTGRTARRLIARTHARADLKQLAETLVRLLVWIFGGLIALTVAIPSFTPAGAFASLGVGALAIGFAFQDIFENFLAGVLIMLRDKMNIGDTIKCQSISGKVEKITLRETHVRQFSGELTVVPNSMLFKNPVEILTDQNLRRTDVTVSVADDLDLAYAKRAIEQALTTVTAIAADKQTAVLAQAVTPASVDFLVQWWCDVSVHDPGRARSDALFAIKDALDRARIEHAPPTALNPGGLAPPLLSAKPLEQKRTA